MTTNVQVNNFRNFYATERYLWHYASVCQPERTWENSSLTLTSGAHELTGSSLVRYSYTKARVLLLIDYAPSLFSYHLKSNQLVADNLEATIERVVRSLRAADSEVELSVILTRLGDRPIKVIVHSYPLKQYSSVTDLLEIINMSLSYKQLTIPQTTSDIYVNFVSLLKWCFFSLTLMNPEALPAVVYITDSVNCQLDPGIYDGLIMQYCRADIAFSVVSLTEGLALDGTQFGYLPDPAALKFFAKMTGGHYISADSPKEWPDLLVRYTHLDPGSAKALSHLHSIRDPIDLTCGSSRHLLEEYSIGLPLSLLLECRVREGFSMVSLKEGQGVLALDCHYNCFVEYSMTETSSGCHVEIRILCRYQLFVKIQQKKQTLSMYATDAKPPVSSRISWLVSNMRETDQTALAITQALGTQPRGRVRDQLVNLPLSKWHRWLEVERLEVIVAKTQQKNLVTQGRESLRDKLQRFGQQCTKDRYLSVLEEQLLLMHIVWQGKTKATVYVGFFGYSPDARLFSFCEMSKVIERAKELELIQRPLGILLVENLKTKASSSNVYSLFTFKPISQVIKSFMFKSTKHRRFLVPRSAAFMLKLSYQYKVHQGFDFLGVTENECQLLVKPIKLKWAQHADSAKPVFFIQNLLYSRDNTVYSEIYLEPDAASCQGKYEAETIKDIRDTYEIHESFLHHSILTFDYLLYSCLKKKLDDTDWTQADAELQTASIVEIMEEDDIYCYYDPNAEETRSFENLKLRIYKKMSKCYNQFDQPAEKFFVEKLLKHATKSLLTLEIYALYNLNSVETWKRSLGTLFNYVLLGFKQLADFYISEACVHYFVRYINDECLLIWTLPVRWEFTQACMETKSYFYLDCYECVFSQIHPTNIQGDCRNSQLQQVSSDTRQIIRKTKTLLERVYQSVYNAACYECILNKHIYFTRTALMSVLSAGESISQVIKLPILNEVTQAGSSASSKLVWNSVLLADPVFRELDQRLKEFLSQDFQEIHQGIFMTNKAEAKMFFTIENGLNTLSNTIYYDSLEVKIFLFNHSCFFSQEWQESWPLPYTDLKYSKERAMLSGLVSTIEQFLFEFILEFLRIQLPLTHSSFYTALEYLPKLPYTQSIEYSIIPAVGCPDYTLLLREEILKSQLLNLRSIGEFYYLVTTKSSTNILEERLDTECEYTIPFWLVIQVTPPCNIVATVFLPDSSCTQSLNLQIVSEHLEEVFREIDVRLNKRLLLTQLAETNTLPDMLIPPEPQVESPTLRRTRRKKSMKSSLLRSPTPASSIVLDSAYALLVQYSRLFKISDRLQKDEGINELITKFSCPPFIIYNRQNMFILPQNPEIFVFKFTDIEYTALQTDRKTAKKREIRFEVFGIDQPEPDTIKQLENLIKDTLRQLSLIKLADSLTKTQKSFITLNDAEFIQGSKPPKVLYLQLPPDASASPHLLHYFRQNLSRFLSIVTCGSESLLLYNFMSPVETAMTTQPGHLVSRKAHNQTAVLGNTFGKALALLRVGIIYFDGESYTSASRLDAETIRFLASESEESSGKPIEAQWTPVAPGNYVEIHMDKSGPLNTNAFIGYLEACASQCVTETYIEQLLQSVTDMDAYLAYNRVATHTKALINESFDKSKLPLCHNSTPFSLFDFFTGCIRIINAILDTNALPHLQCLEESEECVVLSETLQALQQKWAEQYERESGVGRQLRLSCVWSPELFAHVTQGTIASVNQYIKLYPSQQSPRSVLLYLEVCSRTVEVYTYNLSKSLLTRVNAAIENHISWSERRGSLMNNVLIQKLGLHLHELSEVPRTQRSGSFEDPIQANLCRGCNKLELKSSPKHFTLQSLLDAEEIDHDEATIEEGLRKFKMQGMYPLVKYNVKIQPHADKLRQHVCLFNDLYDLKHQLFEQCVNLAFIYKRWFAQRPSPLSSMTSKILAKSSSAQRSEVYLAKSLTKRGVLVSHDKSIFYLVRTIAVDSDLQKNLNNTKNLLTLARDRYARELRRLGKLDVIMVDEHAGSMRKLSFDSSAGSNRLLRHGRSSGGLQHDSAIVNKMYLKRSTDQTIFLVELGVDETKLAVSFYCYEELQQYFQVNKCDDWTSSYSTRKELHRLSNQIRLATFMYDLHIELLVSYLYKAHEYPAIDYVQSLTMLASHFKRIPAGAQCWIELGRVVVDLGDLEGVSVEEIYHYLRMSSEEYGFQSTGQAIYSLTCPYGETDVQQLLATQGTVPALRATVYTLMDTHDKSRTPPAVLLGTGDSLNKLRIQYFILNFEQEKRGGPRDSLKALRQKAEDALVAAIRRVKGHHKRDRLWEKLRDFTRAEAFSFEQFRDLLGSSEVTALEEADNRIHTLATVNKVFVSGCFDYLEQRYAEHCKRFEQEDSLHLIIFFAPRMFAYLTIDTLDKRLRMFSVKRCGKFSKETEQQAVAEVVNEVLRWLWMWMTSFS